MAASPSALMAIDHESAPRIHLAREWAGEGARAQARPTYKECGCGHTYSRSTWQLLEHRGVMLAKEKSIELRQCTCGSTIAVLLEPSGADGAAR